MRTADHAGVIVLVALGVRPEIAEHPGGARFLVLGGQLDRQVLERVAHEAVMLALGVGVERTTVSGVVGWCRHSDERHQARPPLGERG